MTDSNNNTYDSYWNQDIELGEAPIQGTSEPIRLKLHISSEQIFDTTRELVPLSKQERERVYVHGRPYIREPDIIFTVGLYPEPRPDGAIGEVKNSKWTGMRHREIGNCQGWYYPTDRLLVLWEAFPDSWASNSADPRTDTVLTTLWRGFEEFLLKRFSDAQQVVTTWEPNYPRPAWQEFLAQHGYRQTGPVVFAKPLPTHRLKHHRAKA